MKTSPLRSPLLALLLPVLLCASMLANASTEFSIKLANHTEQEQKTQQQLERLLARYDLSRWTFTRSIVINDNEIPHSHPVLTLHARHINDDELLLSTFIHEQLHWFLAQHPAQVAAATSELKHLYPSIPVGYPQGSSDEPGNYDHLLIVALEYRADQTLMGELKAREVMKFWAEDHYTWIYNEVLKNPGKVGQVLKAHDLIPK